MKIFGKEIDFSLFKKKEETLSPEDLVKDKDVINIEEKPGEEVVLVSKKIYMSNNKTLIVILSNGDVLTGIVEPYVADSISTYVTTKEEMLRIFEPPQPKIVRVEKEPEDEEVTIKNEIKDYLNYFKGLDGFEVRGNEVYFEGIKNIPIPPSIVACFLSILQTDFNSPDFGNKIDEFESLKMFTYKLLLNPLETSRNDALNYVKNFNIKLTGNGNMILYRRICSLGEDSSFAEFVSTSYLKVKSWKKSPKNYTVLEENGDYSLGKVDSLDDGGATSLGNLADLYNNLSQEESNRYTDNHSRTYDIRIGSVYRIKDEDININSYRSCGGALHVADGEVYDYSSFGDTPVAVLVNPMHIVKMDTGYSGKIGVREMFIMAITKQDSEGNYENISQQEIVNFDEEYDNYTIEELNNSLKEKSLNIVCIPDEVTNPDRGNDNCVSELSLKEVTTITDILKSRVTLI